MTKPQGEDERFGAEKSQRRFEAALRGARAAEPHPMKEIPVKGARRKKKDYQGERSDSDK